MAFSASKAWAKARNSAKRSLGTTVSVISVNVPRRFTTSRELAGIEWRASRKSERSRSLSSSRIASGSTPSPHRRSNHASASASASAAAAGTCRYAATGLSPLKKRLSWSMYRRQLTPKYSQAARPDSVPPSSSSSRSRKSIAAASEGSEKNKSRNVSGFGASRRVAATTAP